MNRREFLFGAGALATASGLRLSAVDQPGTPSPLVRFGMVADVHFANRPEDKRPLSVVGRRFYRESKRKLDEAVAVFNRRSPDFIVELGDFKDLSGGKRETLACLDEIEASFTAFRGPCYHVLGNHDFDCLTPAEFMSHVRNDGRPMSSGHYAFARNGVTFVVLDCCYDSRMRHYSENNPYEDANVPPGQLAWFERTLREAPGPVVVMTHQRLDPSSEPQHLVRNAAVVREMMERSGKVKLVVTGHQHLGSFYVHNGIRYYSLIALVCDSGPTANSFAEAAVYPDGTISVMGWRNAVSYNCGKGEVLPARCP